MRYYLPDLDVAVRKSGLKVVLLPGWQTRGRPASTGGFDPEGIDCHHTGGYDDIFDGDNDYDYAEWMATVGRSDLPPPLCQVALSAESVVYVCAAGRANHAGTMRASGPFPAGDGNYRLLGIEAMNSGTQGWGSKGRDEAGLEITQYEGYTRLCAALCEHYGWDAAGVRAHWETSVSGKWDPGDPNGIPLGNNRVMDMAKFRARVAELMREDDDEMTPEDRRAVAEEVVKQMKPIIREEVENALRLDEVAGDKVPDLVGGANPRRVGGLLWHIVRRVDSIEKILRSRP